MQIHCLGTAGYHPNQERHTSCYLLPEQGILLDAGTGVFRLGGLLRTDELDVLLSHAHLDHVVGLTFLLDTVFERPLKTVRVWGEPAKLRAVQEHLFHEAIFPVIPPWLIFCRLPESGFKLGTATVTYCQLEHPGGTVGYRLDWGQHSLAYITDTVAGPEAAYVTLIERVDLLLHECNFNDAQIEFAKLTGHSWSQGVGAVAQAAHVKRLALVHVNPMSSSHDLAEQLRSVRERFSNVVLTHDELVLEF